MSPRIDTTPIVTAYEGQVLIDGKGIALATSPEIAAELSDRLADGARDAFGQRAMKEAPKIDIRR